MRRNKFFIGFLLVAFLATTNAGVFAPAPADAGLLEDIGKGAGDFFDGIGKGIEQIGDQLKAFTQINVGGITVDLTQGFSGIQKQLLATLPDEIPLPIPGIGDFTLYTKESPATNIIKNLAPMLSGVMGAIDPLKPIASLARSVIQLAKPYITQYIKPYLPDWLKGGAQGAKNFVKDALKAIDHPLVKKILFPVWDFFIGPLDDLAMDVVDLLAEEQNLPPPSGGGGSEGERMIGAIGVGGDPIPLPPPPVPQDAVGSFDGIDTDGYMHGWAADPDTPMQSVGLEYVIDGAHESFEYTTKENSTAGEQSPLGAAAYPGSHGFRVAIPNKWRDGKPHSVVVKAYDTAVGVGVWSNIITLPGSPRSFTLSGSGKGSIDSLSEAGLLSGWAYDADVVPPAGGGTEVEIYLDGKRGASGTLLGTVRATLPRPDLPQELFTRHRIPSNAIGFTFQVDKTKVVGGRHEVFAYMKDVNSTNGTIQYVELTASRVFYTPIVHQLRFSEDPYVVAQGRWVTQTVSGLPSEYHLLTAYLNSTIIDLNQQERSVYPWMYSADQKYKIVSGPKNGSASTTFQFKIPLDFPLGDHVVQLKTSDAAYHSYTSDRFTLRVIAPSDMVATASQSMTPGTDTEIILSNIPKEVAIGPNGNAALTQVYFGVPIPGYESSDYEPTKLMLQNFRVTDFGNKKIKITALIPLAANSLRATTGPVRLHVIVNANTEISRREFLIGYPYDVHTRAYTAASADPTLVLNCSSTLKPSVSASEIPYTPGLSVQGEGFGCRVPVSTTISGVTLGKQFALSLPLIVAMDDEEGTKWDGALVGQILFPSDWQSKYGDVETLTLEVKDVDGRTATATVNLNVGMRVLPAEGKTEILPGDWFRVVLKKVERGGRRVAVFVDNTEVKRTYIETVPGELSVTIDARLPDDAKPGEHILTLKAFANERLVEEGEGSSTRFIVSAPKVQPKKEEKKQEPEFVTPEKLKSEPAPAPKPKPVPTPKVFVSPAKANPDARVTITATGYNALATMTINVKGQGRSVKLSGYADYTDSSGDLTKEVRLPDDLKGGEYTIEATDIQGLSAKTSLVVDVPPLPAPTPSPTPPPTPEPVSLPTPTAEPTPLPQLNENKTPTCSDGFTYSITLQQCLENAPAKRSPYDGLPCPENYESIPSYAIAGCMPQ